MANDQYEMKNIDRPPYQMQKQPQETNNQAVKEPEKLDYESGEIDPYA